jgi:hypothetical protein
VARYRGRLRSVLADHDRVIFDQIRAAERSLRAASDAAEKAVKNASDPSERYRAARTLRDVRSALGAIGAIRAISPFGSGSEVDPDLMIEPPPFERRRPEPEVTPAED